MSFAAETDAPTPENLTPADPAPDAQAASAAPAEPADAAKPRGTWQTSRRYKVEGKQVVEPATPQTQAFSSDQLQQKQPHRPPQNRPRPPRPKPEGEGDARKPEGEPQSHQQAPRGVKPQPVQGRRLVRLLDEDIGDELAAALGDFNPDQTMKAEAAEVAPPEPGKDGRQTFRVLDVRGNDVFVNLGGKTEGVIPGLQFTGELPKPGDFVEAIVEDGNADDGVVKLRLPGAAQIADWSTVAKGMIVDAQVKKVNKGGLEVLVNNIRGFMPAGQASLERIDDLAVLVNQTLRSEVTEANPAERNLVVSRKAVLLREREEKAAQVWTTLAEGHVRDGVVKRLQDFGAFIDIGGVDGLLPISQMAWHRVKHPSELLEVGQSVKVQIARLDRENRKISLSLKQLTDSPWTTAPERYPAGKVVRGTVSKIMEYGAFVELEPAVEGLIHVSELSQGRVRRVNDVVREGQEVEVKVLGCDVENRRISLSIKQALPEPEPVPTPVEAAVSETPAEPEPAAPSKPKKVGPLKGGLGGAGGPLFG